MSTIFIVDDDPKIRNSLSDVLTKNGYNVESVASPQEFIDRTLDRAPAVAIVDIFFGEATLDGQDLLAYIADKMGDTQCIVISGESDLQKTLGCLKAGAVDFIEKPVSLPRLLTAVKNAAAVHHYRKEAQARCRIIGTSDPTIKMVERTRKLAMLSETVLIRGESGSGKELVAENLHQWSRSSDKPFIKVNCAALSPTLIESELFGHRAGSFTGANTNKKGLIEAANGGTLFIDEIGDFPLHLQSKILRVLQERTILPVGATSELTVDVRFIAATHRDLESMVAAATFREDLLYRIATFTVTVPPLRERISDIDELAPFFARQFTASNNLPLVTFSAAALSKLKTHHYPGNIRELASTVKNAAFNCSGTTIGPEHIDFGSNSRKDGFWKEIEKLTMDDALQKFRCHLLSRRIEEHGNVRKTAESLGILPNNLYRLLKAHGIDYSE